MQVKVNTKDSISLINEIRNLIISRDNAAILDSINFQQYGVPQRLNNALSHLENVDDQIIIEESLCPLILQNDLLKFLEKTTSPLRPKDKTALGDIVKRVLKMCTYIQSLPTKKRSIRTKSPQSIQSELERLQFALKDIINQISAAEAQSERDEVRISSLYETAEYLKLRITELRQENSAAKDDVVIENDWNKRIKAAFNDLSGSTEYIKEEREKAISEYIDYRIIMMILGIFLLIWICVFYGVVVKGGLNLDHWYSITPYYLPVPIFVASFWVVIVQKNRANRISIEMSNELFHIHYLEGLLMTTNRLSSNSEESIERINKVIGSMIESYLHQIEKGTVDEKRIEKLEAKELDSDTYIQLLRN